MKIVGDDISLELTIAGYQFPNPSGNEENNWDLNWLVIEGKVECEDKSKNWTFRDPCLTTFEVEELAKWLEGPSRLPVKIFVEPNLKFTFSPPYLVVVFSHESAPPWRNRGSTMAFTLDKNDLPSLAASLRTQLEKYPFRERK